MKKIAIMIVVVLMATMSMAQDYGRIAINVLVPTLPNVPEEARAALETKMQQVATQHGLASNGLTDRFVMTAKVNVTSKDVAPTTPVKISQKMEVTLFIGDVIDNNVYESVVLSVAGISRVITMDLHADQEQGFFNVPVDHLYASSVMLPYIQSLQLENLVIAAPDVGGTKRASAYSKYLNCPMVICNKTRKKANEVDSMQIIGDVFDANVILIDDIVDTAGTITKAANLMRENGARSVRAIASHCVILLHSVYRSHNWKKWSLPTVSHTPSRAQR